MAPQQPAAASNDSWKMPLPPGVKPEDMPGMKIEDAMKVKLADEIVDARRVLAQSYGKEAESCARQAGPIGGPDGRRRAERKPIQGQ